MSKARRALKWVLSAIFAVFLVTVIAGCVKAPRDYPVVQHNSTATPQVMGIELQKADTSTIYTLWEGTEGVARVKILQSIPLQKGDDIGFKFGAGNQVIAIAGNQQIPLPGQYYYWFRDSTFMERFNYGILAPFGSFLTPKGD